MKKRKFDLSEETPNVAQLEAELKRMKYHGRYASVMKSTIYALITVAAAAVLVATLLLPVLRIYGNSMTPTLWDGNIVVSLQGASFKEGDIGRVSKCIDKINRQPPYCMLK